jgi:(E)-4-hydroxy-3-methylbut-2-enyl-diphosphate synthase
LRRRTDRARPATRISASPPVGAVVTFSSADEIVRVVPEDEMVAALVEEAEKLVAEGIEARLAARDLSAEAEAEADRAALLDDKGADANHASERIERIRRRNESS